MTITVAISNQKGGVAKTTTCQSLGACLAEMGQGVLLIDLDPQAHLTMSMGLDPANLRRTVADALLGNTSLVSVSRETPILGLDIVPANQELGIIDKLEAVDSTSLWELIPARWVSSWNKMRFERDSLDLKPKRSALLWLVLLVSLAFALWEVPWVRIATAR